MFSLSAVLYLQITKINGHHHGICLPFVRGRGRRLRCGCRDRVRFTGRTLLRELHDGSGLFATAFSDPPLGFGKHVHRVLFSGKFQLAQPPLSQDVLAQPHGVPAIAPSLKDGEATQFCPVGQVRPRLAHIGRVRIDADFFTAESRCALQDLIALPRAVKADVRCDAARHVAAHRA